jgi:hypothetical protein
MVSPVSVTEGAAHSAVVVVLLICYTVLTALGHDGDGLLAAGLGYLGGAGVQKAASKTGT